jgi:hypothetical protein
MTDDTTGAFTGQPIESVLAEKIATHRAKMLTIEGDRYDFTTSEPSTVAFIVEPTYTRMVAPRIGLDVELPLEDHNDVMNALRQAVALHAIPFAIEALPAEERDAILELMQRDRPE